MPYNVNQEATVGQLQYVAQVSKAAIEAAIAALPVEAFLDMVQTAFVSPFTWNNVSYPNSTNPNLDGKPVLVFAVKSIDHTNNDAETTTFSFVDMATLVDTYTAASGDSAKILTINGYTIAVNISSVANNAITVQNDGLHVDISGKADKVASATAGHVAGLDANGNPTDTGIVAANVLTTANIATDAEVREMLTEVYGSTIVTTALGAAS
ncbi:MAG: hypothetical protein II877_12370 [Synergistaceae bacterium]|nr:hypothetical protein [Synergistaceae bacterium]MBR0257373.1 hypothetical protein [Synergistaceae bacterium]